jgi:chromosome segregation ATPase
LEKYKTGAEIYNDRMAKIWDNGQNIIDSRDVITSINELEEERDTLKDTSDEAETALKDVAPEDAEETHMEELQDAADSAREDLEAWNDENGEYLKTLQELDSEGRDATSEWKHGEALIRDSYFEEYAQQLADDIGAIDRNAEWPVNCIDWKQAAEQLQQDYSSVDFDGQDYWIRSN